MLAGEICIDRAKCCIGCVCEAVVPIVFVELGCHGVDSVEEVGPVMWTSCGQCGDGA